jgi:uncharacterized protein YaiE (UPF0345 family)
MKKLILFFVLVVSLLPIAVAQAQYSGSVYKVEEAQVGAVGSDAELTSTTYQARATAGDTAVGIVNGTTYQAIGGFTTSSAPELEVIAGSLNLDLGNASVSSSLTGTSQFGVRTYLSEGYTVIIRGVPPTQESGYTMNALATQTSSTVGVEQFGINLVANTSPASFGSAPAQVPDASFSFGAAHANYATTNQYRYVNGDTIATSSSSSGVTNYTISYLVNISSITRAGTYTFNHSVNVVSRF